MKDEQIKVLEFDVIKIHGYIKAAKFKVRLNKFDIEQFNNLNTKEEKISFLENIGDITITDFDIEEFELDINNKLKL